MSTVQWGALIRHCHWFQMPDNISHHVAAYDSPALMAYCITVSIILRFWLRDTLRGLDKFNNYNMSRLFYSLSLSLSTLYYLQRLNILSLRSLNSAVSSLTIDFGMICKYFQVQKELLNILCTWTRRVQAISEFICLSLNGRWGDFPLYHSHFHFHIRFPFHTLMMDAHTGPPCDAILCTKSKSGTKAWIVSEYYLNGHI